MMAALMSDAVTTPAYVADMSAIRRNLAVSEQIKNRTGCTILLATKAFALPALFPAFAAILDGTTASGVYEARLGYEHFGGQVHAYAPAFTDDDIKQLVPICDHISFNSVAQLRRYGTAFSCKGVRVCAGLSQVLTNPIYDPSSPASRFGVSVDEIDDDVLSCMNLLHVHNLCENMAQDSVALMAHLTQHMSHILHAVDAVNIGGGHYITHPEYDVDMLCDAIIHMQQQFNVRVIIEPGGAHVYNAGYIVASVLDIIQRSDMAIAILDISATCHMPDILEVPFRPDVMGDDASHMYPYQLAGNTCLTGDVIGDYRFNAPLQVGQKLVFADGLQYSIVKNTTFNGAPLPDIGVLHDDGRYDVIRRFGYEDFASRLG